MTEKQSILVNGDFVIDQHIYEGRRAHFAQRARTGVKVISELGGAALIHRILIELFKPGPKKEEEVRWISQLAIQDSIPDEKESGLNKANHAYAFWRPCPKGKPPENQSWRASEAMGYGFGDDQNICVKWPKAELLPHTTDIVVFSEGGMGFRDCPEEWRKEQIEAARWIVMKTTSPVGSGKLWEYLSKNHADKLIVIVSAQELRKAPVALHAGLSWEETAEGVVRELRPGRGLFSLVQCRHCIVAFESEGALWVDFGEGADLNKARVRLIHDAGSIEGELSHKTEGDGFGFLSCLAAAVTWKLTENPESPDFAIALEGGLSAMRDLRERGHGQAIDEPRGFPAKRLAERIKRPGLRYSRATYSQETLTNGSNWSFLRQSKCEELPAYDLARLVLLRGPIALENLPHLSIGKLLAADRTEVEAYRTLVQVIRRYQDKKEAGKKPLSIGVFGPPGAGKSFAVKELANSTVGLDGWLEFNLSQFDSPEDLNGAFHQIRDRVLQGQLPVAFFDEFDSQKFRWLQYLLAPMQDGKFQEGQITHTLGKCIFVFAGGTSWTFDTFGPPDSASTSDDSQALREFRLAKGPDFKSRLDSYLDVVGPNRRQIPLPIGSQTQGPIEKVGGYDFIQDPHDIYFPVRRALMARSELKCKPDDKLKIDEGLLHALLHVEKYTHGARSLGKILQPFAVARPEKLCRSLLIPANQLAMHTNAKEFIDLCNNAPAEFSIKDPLTEERIEIIAPAMHEHYQMKERMKKTAKASTDKSFHELEPFFQKSNRASAARMLAILNLVGLGLIDGESRKDGYEEEVEEKEDSIRQYLEYFSLALAEAEHEGWMDWHLAQGWCYNSETQKEKKLHKCLLPFSKLSDADKEKDRDTIRNYPDYARMANMKIVFMNA